MRFARRWRQLKRSTIAPRISKGRARLPVSTFCVPKWNFSNNSSGCWRRKISSPRINWPWAASSASIPAQDFNLADTVPFSPLTSITQEQALRTALDQRPDFQSYAAQVRAAEEAVLAARGQRYPTAGITADYGDVGPALNNSHGTFSFVASAKFNIFDGGRIGADVAQAKATLKQRQDELADLRGQIEYQVRAAFLDIRTAADQVTVALSNLDLANQTLTAGSRPIRRRRHRQHRSRAGAGVGRHGQRQSDLRAVRSQCCESSFGARPGRGRSGNSTLDGGEIAMAELVERQESSAPGRRLGRILAPIVIVAVLAVGGYYLWKYLNTYETTDDAQIDGHINAVSARISGNVVEVLAEDREICESRRRAGPHRSRRTTRSRSPRRKPTWPTPKPRSKARASTFPSPTPIRRAS